MLPEPSLPDLQQRCKSQILDFVLKFCGRQLSDLSSVRSDVRRFPGSTILKNVSRSWENLGKRRSWHRSAVALLLNESDENNAY